MDNFNNLPDLAPPPPPPSILDKPPVKPTTEVVTDTSKLPKKPKFKFKLSRWMVIVAIVIYFIAVFVYVFS